MPQNTEYYRTAIEQLYGQFGTGRHGLSSEEAGERLVARGRNELEVRVTNPAWRLFLSQFTEVFSILLIAAGLLSLALGNVRDTVVILTIAIVNAVIGFVQEYRAERILERLEAMIKSPAKVIRDGTLKKVERTQLVLGDIVEVEEGDKIPADLRIIEAFNFKTNDFALTGESLPQEKHSNAIRKECPVADRTNMAYLGTTVASGTAVGLVVGTGMDTEFGRIADLTQEEEVSESPLEKELRLLAQQLTVLVLIIGVALFFVAQLQGFALQTSLVFALSIAVALVPQALPAQVSVALSQGSGRLAQRNAIVKKLNSMETLGSASTIATDKTGTLTKNEMTVRSLWFNDREYRVTGLGYKPEGDIVDEEGTPLSTKELDRLELMLDCATMASNAEIHPPDEQHHSWYPIGDPTEAALITLSTKAGVRSPREDQENPELEEFPFDSERKRMSSVREIDGRYVLCTKGAPESVLSVAKYWLKDGEVVELTPDKRRELRRIVTEWSARAMRVLAMAYRSLGEKKQDWVEEEVERHVVFLGLAAMVDPPREGVKQAVMEAHQAHIRTLMMTGDHAITARAIAEEVGLIKDNDRAVEYRMPGTVGVGAENKTAPQETELTKPAAAYELSSPLAPATAALRTQFDPETDTGPLASTVITGQELARYSAAELRHTLANYDSLIFSRVSPEDKLRVVKNLKEQGEVVAVTGDGVNDAPALKSAHIGVAMGRIGTDVAKEAAELVLLDDSYSTLVFAVKQGRIIYNNLKKTILASITTNIAELGVVLFSLVGVAVWGWPIAILAIQILTIDLLGEILPLTALTYDPGSGALMRGPPRDQDEHFFDTYTAAEVTFLGLLMAGLAFGGFYWFMLQNGVQLTEEHPLYARATTLTYTVIVFNQYINVLSRRFEFNSVSFQFWTNPILLGTILLSIGLVLLVIYVPFLAAFVGFAPLAPVDWAYVAFAMAVLLATHEAIKYRKRRS